MKKTLLITFTGLLACAFAQDQQYNPIAEKYAEIFEKNNQDSISVYYRYFNFPLTGKKVLDLGCGDGFDLAHMHTRGAEIYGIDSSEKMVDLAREKNPNADIQLASFEKLPFADQTFDLITSKWAFQTAEQIEPIYRELIRVLKPGGQLIYLTCHPIRQFIEKKRKGKNYFSQEIVESVFFDGQIKVYEPSHTLNEYLSSLFFKHFSLEAYEEGFDSGAEKVDGDIFPSYFIIKATLKS